MVGNSFISCIDEQVTWTVKFIAKQLFLPPSAEVWGDICHGESLGRWKWGAKMRKTEEYIREGNFQIKGGKRKKEKKGKKEIDIRTRTLREGHEQCFILCIICLFGQACNKPVTYIYPWSLVFLSCFCPWAKPSLFVWSTLLQIYWFGPNWTVQISLL